MMNILGFYDGHNCSAAIIKNGRILSAIEQERISRIKFHDGRTDGEPIECIEEALRVARLDASQIDIVAVALQKPLQLQLKVFYDLLKERNPNHLFFWRGYKTNRGPLNLLSPYVYQKYRKQAVEKILKKLNLNNAKTEWVDHHKAHAASAYYTCGKNEDVLTVTFDGKGDYLSGNSFICFDGCMKKIEETNHYNSLGFLYSTITHALGFKFMRHEGKITGLAAYGKESASTTDLMDEAILCHDGVMISPIAQKNYLPPYPFYGPYIFYDLIKSKLSDLKLSREDIAYALQKRTERVVEHYVRYWLKKTGATNLALAGGLFANVKVNQVLSEIENLDSIFIHPAMGDSGLALGAAYYAHSLNREFLPIELNDVFFGPEFSNTDIEYQLSLYGNEVIPETPVNIEREIAHLISENKVVARFDGRMEYGPRALGNRSILCSPEDSKINDWLNKRLGRTEFMPFAPTALESRADDLYHGFYRAPYAARFMTVAFDVKDFSKFNCPAVTHVDGSARPQFLRKEYNESYYNVLKHYEHISGLPCVVNTSFNMHEQPIVCTPAHAIRSFLSGKLDYLAIGTYLVSRKDVI